MKVNSLKFNKAFWSERYENNMLGWDTGAITTPIKEYLDQLANTNLQVLIPGCGQGHEARYLHDNGFDNVTVIDLVDEPINKLADYCTRWSEEQFIVGDFFAHEGVYDLIIEQTFFCAIDPVERQQYANKVYDLLKPGGKLVGLLFQFPLVESGPPFGGNKAEYKEYFSSYRLNKMELAYNSIKPRMGAELFINLQRPN